jgi:hypothetical protein
MLRHVRHDSHLDVHGLECMRRLYVNLFERRRLFGR